MEASDRTLTALAFDDLRQALASRCRTDVGNVRALARPFLPNPEAIRGALSLLAEARALKSEPLSLPIAGITDVRTSLDRAQKGGLLEPRELIAVCRALFAFERAFEVLEERRERHPLLFAIARRMPLLGKLATTLDRSFEASGEISDRASPELKEARERARGLHARIRSRLDELLHDEKFQTNLMDGYYSVRNERYVVPVKSSHQREVGGIVHNASQSGQTLFVEPTEMIGLGNDLAIAQSVVLEEERKVLLALSGQVGREAGSIEAGIGAVAELDELEAAAVLSNDLMANAPLLEPPDGEVALKGLRHPRLVLKGGEVVANDVDLSGESRVLVISGPNAGGKTVTLTAVGLCALMVRAGLPIPVDPGSKMPLFNQVHSAIGDLQDLQAGLSTFSAHVRMLRVILDEADDATLVLLDEVRSGTDPAEGAALATAVLEDLLERGALVLVTTHLEELKALAHVDKRFVNARVGFDPKKMSPTYRLQLGFAGASSAIDIARRVGLPAEVCERAISLAQNAGGALSKAIAATEEERRKLYAARDSADLDAQKAKELKASLEAELAAVQKRRTEEELKFREALKAELEFARQQVRALVEALEKDRSDKALKTAQAASAELTKRLNEQTVAERSARTTLKVGPVATEPLEVKPGARARHKGLDADVEIVDVGGDHATVVMGSLKMRVPIAELEGPHAAKPSASKMPGVSKKAQAVERAEAVSAQPLTLAAPTLDLRGQRQEDAMRQVEQFLDRAARNSEQAVIIIHGHGTGALKASVRGYLAECPYAKSFRPGDGSEGGDGVTVVVLG